MSDPSHDPSKSKRKTSGSADRPDLSPKDPLVREFELVENARSTWGQEAKIRFFIPGEGRAGDTIIIDSFGDEGALERHIEERGTEGRFHRRFRNWFWRRQEAIPETLSTFDLSFEEMEEAMGSLPDAAKELRGWWSNSPSEDRARIIWLSVGWEVEAVDLNAGTVRFRRKGARG